MALSLMPPPEFRGNYALRGSYRCAPSTGAVTVIAAKTATAGHIFSMRNEDSAIRIFVKRVAARFILNTAYTTPQETGCGLWIARSYTASHGGGTAIDAGTTITHSGKLMTALTTSALDTAGLVRVASTTALTGSSYTLDAQPLATLSAWTPGLGDTVPLVTSAYGGGYGVLFDADTSAHKVPIVLAQDEGIVIANTILMGAVGVGRWDFLVEWDEGTPISP